MTCCGGEGGGGGRLGELVSIPSLPELAWKKGGGGARTAREILWAVSIVDGEEGGGEITSLGLWILDLPL